MTMFRREVITPSPLFVVRCHTLQFIQRTDWQVLRTPTRETWDSYFTQVRCTFSHSTLQHRFSPLGLFHPVIVTKNEARHSRWGFAIRNIWPVRKGHIWIPKVQGYFTSVRWILHKWSTIVPRRTWLTVKLLYRQLNDAGAWNWTEWKLMSKAEWDGHSSPWDERKWSIFVTRLRKSGDGIRYEDQRIDSERARGRAVS